jgi:hypothetical protein
LPDDQFICGTFARWNENSGWVDRDKLPLPSTMFVIGTTTVLQKWKDGKAEVKSTHPLPNADELNAAIPKAEWEPDLTGKPTPPWKLNYVAYMVDLNTGAIFTYANHTWGAKLAVTQLEEQIAVMRMLRNENVLPIVRLEKRPMKTDFGMKSRPHFQIIDWRALGGGGPKLAPQPPTPQISGPPAPTTTTQATPTTPTTPTASTAAPASTSATKLASTPTTPATAATASTILDHTKRVKPVTVAELIADELPPWA